MKSDWADPHIWRITYGLKRELIVERHTIQVIALRQCDIEFWEQCTGFKDNK